MIANIPFSPVRKAAHKAIIGSREKIAEIQKQNQRKVNQTIGYTFLKNESDDPEQLFPEGIEAKI